jgi:hypothetical protein
MERERHTHTHRDGAALAHDGHDGVVAGRPAGGRVDDDPNGLVLHEREGVGVEHALDVRLAEDLLERVEGEAGELGLDEVRTVLKIYIISKSDGNVMCGLQ